MPRNWSVLPALTTVVIICLTSTSAFGIIIDDFNVDNARILEVDDLGTTPRPPTDSTVNAPNPAPTTSILGGQRDTTITIVTGSAGIASADVFAEDTLKINNGDATNSTTTVTWDANGAGLDADFSAFNAFSLDIVELDGPGQTANFQLDLIDTGNGTAQLTGISFTSTSSPDSGRVVFGFGSFATTGSFSFASVDSIALTVTGTDSFDLQLDNFQAVPEPSTWALFGVVCLGVAICYRRRKLAGRKAKSESQGGP